MLGQGQVSDADLHFPSLSRVPSRKNPLHRAEGCRLKGRTKPKSKRRCAILGSTRIFEMLFLGRLARQRSRKTVLMRGIQREQKRRYVVDAKGACILPVALFIPV